MRYFQPYGMAVEVTWGDTPYVNGDPSIGRAGSIPPAESIEHPQREIVNIIRNVKKGDGTAFLTPTGSDLTQLAQAVQSLLMNYARDTGSLNNYSVTMSPAPTAYYEGLTVNMRASLTNTGAPVINVNALGSKSIIKPDGSVLTGGEIVIGSEQTLRYDGTAFQIVGGLSSGVQRLSANKDLYVNNSFGAGSSDLNDGTANTSGKALLTIQKAVDIAFGYAPSQFTITIHISGHTYSAGGKTPFYPGPSLAIDGAGSASTLINAGNDYGLLVQGPNTMTTTNVKVANTVSAAGPAAFAALSGATMNTANTASGVCGGSVFGASGGGSMNVGTHNFNGNCYAPWWASAIGLITLLQSSTYTFTGAVNITIATAFASGSGVVQVSATNPVTFVNGANAIGLRFNAIANGVINVNGQGNVFFPGSIAGTTTTGGQYI